MPAAATNLDLEIIIEEASDPGPPEDAPGPPDDPPFQPDVQPEQPMSPPGPPEDPPEPHVDRKIRWTNEEWRRIARKEAQLTTT